MRPIVDVAADLGLSPSDLSPFGHHMAKVSRETMASLAARPVAGRIVLVSAMTPTPAGEGKTTVSVGLAQGLRRLGHKAALALREPSLGPIFGRKGGGTGGGLARLEPSAKINLHFTGDMHAVTAAHDLLAALADNTIHFNQEPDLDPRKVLWRRVMDVNDRALRSIVTGLGGSGNGPPREAGFDITAASEVMAILCLATDLPDLKRRLGAILVGFDRKGEPVTAARLGAPGPMAALLYDAVLPNLVQSVEGVPAFVHGGPFGNIAHGCNSILATRTAARLADIVVTEAGFAFDLGAEKFLDIKCRVAGLWPRAVVLVATARALRYHGGDTELTAQGEAGRAALVRGFGNLGQHIASVRGFGFDPIVAINCFSGDPEDQLAEIEQLCATAGVRAARYRGFAEGGAGAEGLARLVAETADRPAVAPRFLYELDASPEDKLTAIARGVYGAKDVVFTADAQADLTRIRKLGYDRLPVCVAKTHMSLSDRPEAIGRPRDFTVTVRQLRIAAGAGYLLALTGEIMTMPGLPKKPAALNIDLTDDGEIVGVV